MLVPTKLSFFLTKLYEMKQLRINSLLLDTEKKNQFKELFSVVEALDGVLFFF